MKKWNLIGKFLQVALCVLCKSTSFFLESVAVDTYRILRNCLHSGFYSIVQTNIYHSQFTFSQYIRCCCFSYFRLIHEKERKKMVNTLNGRDYDSIFPLNIISLLRRWKQTTLTLEWHFNLFIQDEGGAELNERWTNGGHMCQIREDREPFFIYLFTLMSHCSMLCVLCVCKA